MVVFWVRACAQLASALACGDEQNRGGAAALGLGEHRACADVDAADERNVHSLRQRARPVRDDDLAFHVDARKRVDVPAGHRPAVPDVDDRHACRRPDRQTRASRSRRRSESAGRRSRSTPPPCRPPTRASCSAAGTCRCRPPVRGPPCPTAPRCSPPPRSKPGEGVLRPLSSSDDRYSRSRASRSAVMRSAALRTGSGRPAGWACNTTPPSNARTTKLFFICSES